MEYFFQRVHPSIVPDYFVSLIEKSAEWETSEGEAYDILALAADDKSQIWLYVDEENSRGVVVTAITEEDDGKKSLCFWRFIGQGLVKNIDKIMPELIKFGQENSCDFMYILTKLVWIAKIAEERAGFKIINSGDVTMLERRI